MNDMLPQTRRQFVSNCARATAGYFCMVPWDRREGDRVMTVNGWCADEPFGYALIHEHIMVDFIGADKADPSRYDADEVFNIALPMLLEVKEKGCHTMVECTPAFLGRDVRLLKRLSDASGINMVTNTGYYGASGEKYFPAHAYTDTVDALAQRWIAESRDGIEGTGIKPGFIKSGVDKLPFTPTQVKVIEAAAMTHLATGLTIGIHTGNGDAAVEEKRIIESKGVAASAWIWIHAQNEKDHGYHVRIANDGGWVSYDGVHDDAIEDCISLLKVMQKEKLLHRMLLSHDSGWYHVGSPNGGTYNGYTTIFNKLIPAMKRSGFTERDIRQLFHINPFDAYSVRVRKKMKR